MEIDTLKALSLVWRHGSFAAAARVLSVNPSTVSRAVSNVEASLGMRLFHRTTRTLTTTEEGEIYLRRIAPALEELDHAREAATRSLREPSGTLKLTASVAFSHECIVPHLSDFHASYPEVSLELLPTDANLDLVANGIDLAVRLAAAPEGDLISTRLLSTRYRVCASPAYLESHGAIDHPQDLAGRACLRFALPQYRTRWRFRKQGTDAIEVPVAGRTVIANALSLRRAAMDGLGPVLLADWLVAKDIATGALVDLFPDWDCTATEFDSGAWALYPSRGYLPRKVRVMIDFLRDRLKAAASAGKRDGPFNRG